MLFCAPWFGIWGTVTLRKERPRARRLIRFRKFNRQKLQNLNSITLTSSTESATARENNTVFERPETVSSLKRCQGGVTLKNLASVGKGSSSTGLFSVPKSPFLNMCSLDKIKNRIRPSVALRQIFDRGISMLAIFQRRIFADRKMTVLLLLEGILYIEGIEIGLDLISERKVEFQYMCGKTLRFWMLIANAPSRRLVWNYYFRQDIICWSLDCTILQVMMKAILLIPSSIVVIHS